MLDVVVPVHDEQAVLVQSVGRLHDYLSVAFPFSWRVTIVDNGSTDGTAEVAAGLASMLPSVRTMRLGRKGRGLALRSAWAQSEALVVAYMDVDLSTGLDALLPLVAPLVTGHSDVAIGSRLAPGANVARGPKREVISRIYNLLLRGVFASRFHDAQCGFKAMRADVARLLLPQVADDKWFFDTELLLLAEHNGLRIHELPVDWVDDPDSRVRIVRTAIEDLRGAARMALRLGSGRGAVDLGTDARLPFPRDMGRHLVVFAMVGIVNTLVSVALFVGLRPAVGPSVAVAGAMLGSSVGSSWAHRRSGLDRAGPGLPSHVVASLGLTAVGVVVSVATVRAAGRSGGGVIGEVAGLLVTWVLVAAARFRLLRRATAARPARMGHRPTGPRPSVEAVT